MKRTIVTLSALSICLASCFSTQSLTRNYLGNSYTYHYDMVKPVEDSSLKYSDDKLDFTFSIDDKSINFNAKNKTDRPLKIVWDEASFVQFGKAGKVMHEGVKFAERNSSMPPTTIPPSASVEDIVLPTANVTYYEGHYTTYYNIPASWNKNDLFINHDMNKDFTKESIREMVGQEITLYLPIRDNTGQELGYTFTFRVNNVICNSCNTQAKN